MWSKLCCDDNIFLSLLSFVVKASSVGTQDPVAFSLLEHLQEDPEDSGDLQSLESIVHTHVTCLHYIHKTVLVRLL